MKVSLTGKTGRDKFVICKALAYAILTIEKLTYEQKETNDLHDMRRLLDHYNDGQQVLVDFHLDEARRHMERNVVIPFPKK